RGRILEPEDDRLEGVTPEHRHELLVFAPDLRLEGRAVGAEPAHHVPVPPSEVQGLADTGVIEPARHLLADADLRLAALRFPTRLDLHVSPHPPSGPADGTA